MEFAETCALMFCICSFGTLIYSHESPLKHWSLSSAGKSFLMGTAVALTTFLIIHSPFGRRTGAHFNPAITITYFYLDRVHHWDTLHYILSQFAGGLTGVLLAYEVFGSSLSSAPVSFVITTPGYFGSLMAFAAEFLLSGLMMGAVLFATNWRPLAKFSPIVIAGVTVFYYVLCPSISGFSVNPARSFASAFFARVWYGIWVYFVAPCAGMLAAANLYLRLRGPEQVYCAKIYHDMQSVCPFNCQFYKLPPMQKQERTIVHKRS